MMGVCGGLGNSPSSVFVRGDSVCFKGVDSEFRGMFLCYIDKLSWCDSEGNLHEPSRRCLVQQYNTGMVFVKPEPKAENMESNID